MSDTPARNHDSFEFDALAELFLGDTAAPAPDPGANGHHADVVGTIGVADAPTRRPSPKTVIEALVIGHLPVRTGPWLSQYAAAIARADQMPVALLRLGEGEARIELVGGPPTDRPDPAATLEEAIGVAASRTGRWMIQAGDLDVPWLLNSPLLDAVTLLAGGNEAALVDAYRTIKALVAGAPPEEGAERADPETAPAIRLAILGADEARAREVADRLRDASRAFLGREIELAAGIREMGPTNAVPLYRGRTTLDIRAILDDLRRGSRPRPASEAAPPPRSRSTPAPDAPTVPVIPNAPAEAVRPAAPVRTASEPRHAPERAVRGSASTALAAHLEGLCDLAIPYPDDPSVQFAIDGDARLHILRQETDGAGVSALTAASAWAARHLALINMAVAPQGPLCQGLAPALHLFTTRPASLRPLLDADIRLHALAPVRRDREWVSLDLN